MRLEFKKNSFKRVTKKQAINKLMQGSTIGVFDKNGDGYIIDDFDDLLQKYPNDDRVKQIITLNMDNWASGMFYETKYSYYEIPTK